jgi:hypothetical protein
MSLQDTGLVGELVEFSDVVGLDPRPGFKYVINVNHFQCFIWEKPSGWSMFPNIYTFLASIAANQSVL